MKYFTLLLLGVFCAISANAQTAPKAKVITVTGQGDSLIPLSLKRGSRLAFRFTNVNPYRLKGAVTVSKKSLELGVPANLMSFLSAPVQEPGKNTSRKEGDKNVNPSFYSSTENESSEKLRQQMETLQTNFIRSYNCFLSTYNKIILYASAYDYLDSATKEVFVPDPETLKENLNEYMEGISGCPKTEKLRGLIITELQNLDNSYLNAKDAYEKMTGLRSPKEIQLTGQLADKNKSIVLKLDDVTATIANKPPFEKEFISMTERYETVVSKRSEITARVNHAVDYFNKLNKSCFTYISDAVPMDEDQMTLTPKLVDHEGKTIKEYPSINVRTYSKDIKVDLSSGYLLSFLGDQNYTNLYSGDSLYGVQASNQDNLKHAVGILFHAYVQTKYNISFGGAAGFSVPTDGTAIGFYLGGSALMLEKNRLVISAGLAFNRVKRLNTGNLAYDTGETGKNGKASYRFASREYREINYDNVYRPAFFVGISYNIASIVK